MVEFMEYCGDVVEVDQCWLVGSWFGEVVDVVDYWFGIGQVVLFDEYVYLGVVGFVVMFEVVGVEQGQ